MLSRVLDDYGGAFVDAEPVANPESELSADKHNRMAEDAAQMTHTAVRAELHFSPVASGDPTVSYYDSVWSGSSDVQPTVARDGAGDYTITFPAFYTDALGVQEFINIRSVQVSLLSDTDSRIQVTDIDGNVVSVRLRDDSGVASDLDTDDVAMIWFR